MLSEEFKKVINYYKDDFKKNLLIALKPFEDELKTPYHFQITVTFDMGGEGGEDFHA